MQNQKLSIIIASRNCREDMEKCLASLSEHCNREDIEVIVSDNNSVDGTVEMIGEYFPQVKISVSDQNGSYASAINRGINASSGEYILCLDSDAIIQEETIPELVNFLDSHPDTGAAVSKMYYPDGSVQLMARRFPALFNSLFGRETIFTKLFPDNKISKKYLMINELNQTEPFEADWASSACMMIKRDVLNEAGLLDEEYLLYWADADWCRRINNCGWKIYCIPDSAVIHDMRNNGDKKKSYLMIKAFHQGAYRYFRKFLIKSPFNPLNLIAIVGLSGRATLHLLLNYTKSDKEPCK